jgi:Fur family ferric uptake transcriptional regulator
MHVNQLDIEALCLSKGLKLTEQRKVIAQVISASGDHPHVEEVYQRASAIDNKISLATVYRTINLLESYGVIEKLEFGDGRARYEPKRSEADHHHHLIDLTTGKIIEFYDAELEKLKADIAAKLGYQLVDHRLELFGVPLKNKN